VMDQPLPSLQALTRFPIETGGSHFSAGLALLPGSYIYFTSTIEVRMDVVGQRSERYRRTPFKESRGVLRVSMRGLRG